VDEHSASPTTEGKISCKIITSSISYIKKPLLLRFLYKARQSHLRMQDIHKIKESILFRNKTNIKWGKKAKIGNSTT